MDPLIAVLGGPLNVAMEAFVSGRLFNEEAMCVSDLVYRLREGRERVAGHPQGGRPLCSIAGTEPHRRHAWRASLGPGLQHPLLQSGAGWV